MAQIIVNDEKQEVSLPLTLAELIKINKVFQPEMVTIQVNEDFAEKEDYEKIQLKNGDRRFPLLHGRRRLLKSKQVVQ